MFLRGVVIGLCIRNTGRLLLVVVLGKRTIVPYSLTCSGGFVEIVMLPSHVHSACFFYDKAYIDII